MILLYNLYPLTWAFFCPISHYIFWFGCHVRHLGSFPIDIHRLASSIAAAQLLTAGHLFPPLSLSHPFLGVMHICIQCIVVPKQKSLENGKLGSIQLHLARKQISNLQKLKNVSQMRMKKMVFASNLFACRRDFSGY